MAIPRLTRKTVIKGFVESTYGIGPTDWTATDVFYIPAENVTVRYLHEDQTRELMKPTYGASKLFVSQFHAEVTFTVELRGDGMDGNNVAEPVFGKLLKGCIYVESTETDADGNIITRKFKPVSAFPDSGKSLSLKVWYAAGDGNQAEAIELNGCVGTYTIRADRVGDRVTAEFTFTGKLNGTPTAEALPTMVEPPTKPLFLQGITLTIGSSTAYCLGGIEITGGNNVRLRRCASEVDGIVGAYVGNREITGRLDLEGYLPTASQDPEDLFAKFRNGDTFSLILELDSGEDGNHVKIVAPNVQITDLDNEDRDELLFRRHTLRFIDTGNDDDIEFQFLV